ncbi:hypothetical protein [Lachnoclostridium phytofermentans]|uniref:Uncharacterized protein n=1 Tax=Lachnoclostridium phytofermentans (strain ATCC 700394 / DSM 18823 / ISDg) TaxID=357809 RepID=A9KQ35_LACP7|nr:hypothetical protein [Lachnoclostridium phytofermentans]ABX43347.1 hypothetical protein Cphy_2990 [Lachnoclostridium phytofermentans ISDg]
MINSFERDNFYMLSWLDQFMTGYKGFIAGGSFKNIFNHEKVKDLDIFFESKVDFDSAVEHFDKMCGENNTGGKYHFYYENKNVKAYKHVETGITLELCCKVFGSARNIISQFDFTITKFAYFKEQVKDAESDDNHIEYMIACDDKFFEHLHLKRLVTDDKILYPMSTFERMIRYIKYGYMPCKETKLRIASAISELSKEQIDISNSLYEGVD